MEGSRVKWTDERIDDIVRAMHADFDELKRAVHADFDDLKRRLDRRDAERIRERELVVQHRREDRKFNVTLSCTVAAILLTATGILVSVLT